MTYLTKEVAEEKTLVKLVKPVKLVKLANQFLISFAMASIFSRIIAGEIPSYKIYEDDTVYAFLTIGPHTLGHTLVVPKEEVGNILDLSDDLYTHLMLTAKNII